jgi:phosphoketolase
MQLKVPSHAARENAAPLMCDMSVPRRILPPIFLFHGDELTTRYVYERENRTHLKLAALESTGRRKDPMNLVMVLE